MKIKTIKQNRVSTLLLSQKLKSARIFSFGTVIDLASASNLSTQAVVSAERHDHNSTISTILNICHATGSPVSWLVDDDHVLPDQWKEVVTGGKITKNSRIPKEPPWIDFSSLSESVQLTPQHMTRLQVLSRRLGIEVGDLIYQLLNEGLAIKEAQFEAVVNESLDVDLFRELVDIYERIELGESKRLSKQERNKIIKSIYYDLESRGISAASISVSDVTKIIS